ncbi:MAG TPA: NAD(P)H-binding protein [Acidimicrobiia bacterium]|nr:NAD(P)H-binding protein [Acidimicrobiia bacterium]
MSTIFVTGATGELGRGAIPHLLAAGHTVRGVARSDEKAAELARAGVEPVRVDLFDATAVSDAVRGTDAVLHLATSIPPMSKAKQRHAWDVNDRLRSEGTRILVDAALAAGASTFVAESITFPYRAAGDDWIDEDSPFDARPWLASVADLEDEIARFSARGGVGVALRFGMFAGPTARSTDELLGMARRGVAPVVGRPDAYLSSIHTDDAGSAVASALAAPAGTYNVVDDEPLTRRDYADAFARAFGLRRPRFLPGPMVRLATGPAGAVLGRSQRVSNRRFRERTGWAPHHRNAWEAWSDIAQRRTAAASR